MPLHTFGEYVNMFLKDTKKRILWKYMQYNELKEQLRDFAVFSLSDIRKIETKFHRPRLSEWQHKGYIKKLRRGYYMFADAPLNEESLFLIANKLYSPSYVSFEMALSYYGLIPEGVYSITSACGKKTTKFKTPIGEFAYRKIKPELLFGYRLQKQTKQRYKIAEMEKAVLDYLYLNPRITRKADIYEWRFNGAEFLAKVDMNKFNKYLKAYKNHSLERRVKNFIKFINKERQ